MTVPVQVPINTYVANGATTVFPYSYLIIEPDDISVLIDGVKQVSGFTVSGVGNQFGGNITITPAPVNGAKIILILDPPLRRVTDYQQFGDWLAENVNPDFDRIWLAMQAQATKISYALAFPISDGTPPATLPARSTFAGKFFVGDASGNPVPSVGIGSDSNLRTDIAATTGGGLIGYDQQATYPALSLGRAMQVRKLLSQFPNVFKNSSTDSAAGIAAAIAAMPQGSELIIDGYYYSSTSQPTSKVLRLKGSNSSGGNNTTIANVGSGVYFYNDNDGFVPTTYELTVDGVIVLGNPGIQTHYGINAVSTSIKLLGNSLIQGFLVGAKVTDGHYNVIDNSAILGCNLPLLFDTCHNVRVQNTKLQASSGSNTICIEAIGGELNINGGSIENQKLFGIQLLGGAKLNLLGGTYFEGDAGRTSWGVNVGAGCSVASKGSMVYGTKMARWISIDSGSSTGVSISSELDRFVLPTNTDAFDAFTMLNNDPLAQSDIRMSEGNWDTAGPNVKFLGASFTTGTGPNMGIGNHRIVYPSNHASYGKNIDTTPFALSPSQQSFTPGSQGAIMQWQANGAGGDPLNIRAAAWGANPYYAVYEKAAWRMLGLRMANITNSVGGDESAKINAILQSMRDNGVMI